MNYKKLIIAPVIIIIISLYLIGINLINRIDKVDNIKDVVPSSSTVSNNTPKTEEQEDKELEIIGDKININTATESELRSLDGIGEKTARRIIEKREKLGGFSSIEDILEVEGIGSKTFEQIKHYITVE